ncbi:MAG: hypothetical protein ACI9BD_000137, partial [Candidatus Marinamargulisbacteria bacterium]
MGFGVNSGFPGKNKGYDGFSADSAETQFSEKNFKGQDEDDDEDPEDSGSQKRKKKSPSQKIKDYMSSQTDESP